MYKTKKTEVKIRQKGKIMRITKRNNGGSVSLFAIISFGITLVCLFLLFLSSAYVGFADFMNDTLCFGFRRVMAAFADLFPFSLFEVLLFASPLIVVAVVIGAVRVFKKGEGKARYFINVIACLLLFYSGNVIALSISYNTTTVDREMNFSIVEVNKDNLSELARSLIEEINYLSSKVKYENGVSVAPYSEDVISEKICESYSALSEKYGFVPDFKSRAKFVRSGSVIMSYLGITGIYSYYTGEANVSTSYPCYDRVFVAAHELAHQRGVLRENEANFVAYLVCSSSDDVYLRYCGALNLYSYVASALYRTDKEEYFEVYQGLCEEARSDLRASSAVTQKYGDTIFEDISSFVNDLFLKSNGTDGVVTYGRVVTLAVSYFEAVK